jgi:F-type H+-transporting ATPase subunit b
VLIDPFTIIAQIVNFLILVFLLWYFLYKPVIRTMDGREQMIRNRLDEAEQREREADREKKEFEDKRAEIEKTQQSMLDQAKKEAEEKRKELLRQAREDADEARARWVRAVAREKETFLGDLKHRAVHEIYRTTEEALRDLADKDIESGIIRVFEKRIREMDPDKRDEIKSSLSESEELTVKSSFEIDDESKDRIRKALADNLTYGIKVNFDTSPDVVAGIELTVEGYKIAWSIADYLGSLEESLSKAMEKEIEVSKEAEESEQAELMEIEMKDHSTE